MMWNLLPSNAFVLQAYGSGVIAGDSVQAGEDFTLSTLQVESSHEITWSQHNYHRQSSSAEVGTQISGGGAVNLVAQGDLSARAAMVNAQGALSLQSTDGSVNIEAGQSSESLAESQRSVSRGTLSKTTTIRASSSQSTMAQASELGGQSVVIQSGADTRIVGTNVLADENLEIQAETSIELNKAQLGSGRHALVQSKKGDVALNDVQIDAAGQAVVMAAGQLSTTSAQSENHQVVSGVTIQSRTTQNKTRIAGEQGVTVHGGSQVHLQATDVESEQGKVKVTSTGAVILDHNTDTEQRNWTTSSTKKSWGGAKKKTTITHHETQTATAVETTLQGKEIEVVGQNVVSVGARFESEGLLHIEGVDKTLLYATENTQKSQLDSKTTSSFAGIGYKKSSSQDTRFKSQAVRTELVSDEAVRIGVGERTELVGARVQAPQIDFVNSQGAIDEVTGQLLLGAAIEQETRSTHTTTTSLGVWQKQEGSGVTEQTAVMTQLNGQVTFGEGLQMAVDVPQVQAQGQTQTPGQPLTGANLQRQIEQLAGQSGLGYLQQLQNNPDVKFNEVKLAVDSWSYKQQGLTEAGAALVAIAVAVATGGAGAGLVGTTTATATGTVTTLGGMTLATTTAATATAAATATTFAAGAAVNAGFAALASQAAVSFANNGGDLGQTLKDMGDKDAVKNILIAMGTAGVGASVAGQGVNAVAAQTLTGCVAGEVSGAGCESGAKTAAVLSGAGEAYRALVGYAANAGPGENRPGSTTGNGAYQPIRDEFSPNYGQQLPADQGMNVIGLNKPGSLLSQGGAVSRALNQVPFVNATAGIHDYMFNANPDLNFTLWNVPTMLPAAAIAIPASLNNPNIFWLTQIKPPSTVIKPSASSSIIRVDNPLPRPAANTTEATR